MLNIKRFLSLPIIAVHNFVYATFHSRILRNRLFVCVIPTVHHHSYNHHERYGNCHKDNVERHTPAV